MIFDLLGSYSFAEPVAQYSDVQPNLKTGEGRAKCRPLSRHKIGDQKKKTHRKMTKRSRGAEELIGDNMRLKYVGDDTLYGLSTGKVYSVEIFSKNNYIIFIIK